MLATRPAGRCCLMAMLPRWSRAWPAPAKAIWVANLPAGFPGRES